jgi:hypothetical protein
MTTGPEPISAPGIHDAPPADTSAVRAANAKLQAQLKSRSEAIRYHLLADVLYALAGSVSGVPLLAAVSAQLSAWANDLEQRAQDALTDAAIAQGSANYANSQLSILTGGALASNVTGGISLSETFTGASANTLGASFSRTSDGPGAGNFGPNGNGQAVWKKSGGLWRRHIDRNTTALATDYVALFVVIAKPAEAPSIGSDAYTYLIARCNAAADTFLYCRIGRGNLEIGKRAGSTWSAFTSVTITCNPGDQFTMVVGTTTDDREIIVRQNGIARITYTDTSASALCSDAHATVADHTGTCTKYSHVGLASQCAERNFLTDQTRPAELDVWSAADRLPATV